MKFSKKDIQHIANLARLELTDEELKIYGSQLSDILNYIGQLREVDVSGVEPTAQTAGLENIFREDEIEEWDEEEREAALNQSPMMENGFVKVKRVLE
ncbi:Asp-tRNA(Asn)/Glu-tRNA(Gln) amidotransferase subunit GatC [Patescibacteria group bacterium]|nr:Asp-tRNA(Asn)/Glu-tRNA(Gln) amidotransferase subunit GatC [Patescibacteria group bacterium]MBU4347143.1 Asp-tRNA(Asn)/Glu-tRNA(Gln) amidotransferase subunit GatC [Patescibacteria group bacterium]MBU4455628.1 Asp-tRNA(Asn)/Glu-tRNA(Gln) amidotransferase subunit GatC [Patescibacteria group bacterium]MCG2691050.1 Asp-tRNA(Asn)/Glu-tRNA(Gln) amidotransferase subunit GatC [Candidatus Parcubacteria bacterium]